MAAHRLAEQRPRSSPTRENLVTENSDMPASGVAVGVLIAQA